MMKVVVGKPPMWGEMLGAFPNASKVGVLVTWGDTIYLPNNEPGRDFVSPELQAHEGIHFSRQTRGFQYPYDQTVIEGWWRRYIEDPEFRAAEEVPAYRAQARQFKAGCRDRNAYFKYVAAMAEILGGPLYGRVISPAKARQLILA